MAVDQNRVVGDPPLLQTFVAGPLLQTLVADLCVEYCSLQGACRRAVCRRRPPCVTNLCREMAAQACYKANVLDSLPYGDSTITISGIIVLSYEVLEDLGMRRNKPYWGSASGSAPGWRSYSSFQPDLFSVADEGLNLTP